MTLELWIQIGIGIVMAVVGYLVNRSIRNIEEDIKQNQRSIERVEREARAARDGIRERIVGREEITDLKQAVKELKEELRRHNDLFIQGRGGSSHTRPPD